MRARLAASSQPRRIFDAVLAAARQAGALFQRRVLDSVPIYDAVATQDTATMLHRAIRAVLAAASDAALRGDYASGAKAHCDWDDPQARQELVDRLGADAAAVLAALEDRELRGALSEAAELLAAVAGQDLCQDRGGRFMIARRVAKDRVLSTVDPDTRHGHKSTARRFDGYKGHTCRGGRVCGRGARGSGSGRGGGPRRSAVLASRTTWKASMTCPASGSASSNAPDAALRGPAPPSGSHRASSGDGQAATVWALWRFGFVLCREAGLC